MKILWQWCFKLLKLHSITVIIQPIKPFILQYTRSRMRNTCIAMWPIVVSKELSSQTLRSSKKEELNKQDCVTYWPHQIHCCCHQIFMSWRWWFRRPMELATILLSAAATDDFCFYPPACASQMQAEVLIWESFPDLETFFGGLWVCRQPFLHRDKIC